MKIPATKIFLPVLPMLFCFMFLPQIACASHILYSSEGGTEISGKTCGATIVDKDSGYDSNGDPTVIIKTLFTCGSWQKSTRDSGDNIFDRIQCFCDKDCLDYAKSPRYWDDPVNKRKQAAGNDVQNITLPVVLAWTDVRGFSDNHGDWDQCSGDDGDCIHSGSTRESGKPRQGDGYGPIAYRIQIQDESDTGIANINIPATKKNQIADNGNGKKAFEAVLHKRGDTFGFNSRDDGDICFFNSTDTYRWRVTACCDYAGEQCKDWPADWWTFTVATAPEMVSPLDPDWNGPGAITDISFKDISPLKKDHLWWCPAKLPSKPVNYQTIPGQIQYAKSYKLEVTSNEENDFTKDLFQKIKNFWSWITSSPDAGQSQTKQATHALSIINGGWTYDILPTPGIDFDPPYDANEVETWYPAQSRQDLAYFSRHRTYSWKLKSCWDDLAQKCFDDNSQTWKITTRDEEIAPPEATAPKDDPDGKEPVGFPITISWTIPAGANSFNYTISGPGLDLQNQPTTWNTVPNNEFGDAQKKLFALDNPDIRLNADYKWQVQSCAQFDPKNADADNCRATGWSKWFSFRTTGRPPDKKTMLPNIGSATMFPQNFAWGKVPGAKSYNIELWEGAKKIAAKIVKVDSQNQNQPGAQFDYPDIQPPVGVNSRAYTWKVQTCADDAGKKCGDWVSQYFNLKRPDSPVLQNKPAANYGSLSDVSLDWTGPTKHYWITVEYNPPQPQTQSGCSLKNPIVSKNIEGDSCSVQNDCLPSDIKTSCAGSYKWTVQPCANPDCSDKGNDNAKSSVFAISAGTTKGNSLAVCGQQYNAPGNSWDETEKCEIRHIFLLAKVLINYLLFRVSILLLPIMALVTGLIFYFGKEGPNTIPAIKKMWKWIGIGYAILFMAWLLTSWLMAAAGYKNDWWKIL